MMKKNQKRKRAAIIQIVLITGKTQGSESKKRLYSLRPSNRALKKNRDARLWKKSNVKKAMSWFN